MLRRAAGIPAAFPVSFGCGISSVKTAAADAIAQLYVEGRSELDLRRNAMFGLWGLGYLGFVQYMIYVPGFTRLFPSVPAFVAKPLAERLRDRAGQRTVLLQVGLDQFVHHPLLLFPCFYTFKGLIENGGLDVPAALAKYRENAWEDLRVCWGIWVPAFLVNFSVCPLWARVPFVATISFGFTTYFSFLRGAPHAALQSGLHLTRCARAVRLHATRSSSLKRRRSSGAGRYFRDILPTRCRMRTKSLSSSCVRP